jgi:hypothetical protein
VFLFPSSWTPWSVKLWIITKAGFPAINNEAWLVAANVRDLRQRFFISVFPKLAAQCDFWRRF